MTRHGRGSILWLVNFAGTISMVPGERKADLDEFDHGLEFVRSRVNGISD